MRCRADAFDPGEIGRGAVGPRQPRAAARERAHRRRARGGRRVRPPRRDEPGRHRHRGDARRAPRAARRCSPTSTAAADAAARLADAHRGTVVAGRTLLQQALPVTFGLKAAGWLTALDEARRALDDVRERAPAVQLGGAAGTLASLGDRGLDVAADVRGRARTWPRPCCPWHTIRTRPAELAGALGAAAGVARQGRARRHAAGPDRGGRGRRRARPGRGGSSTMPHKRNPVAAISAAACAAQAPGLVATLLAAMAHEHERAAGAGTPSGDRSPSCCARPARPRHGCATAWRGSRSTPARCARTSTSPAACCSPSA